MIPIQTSPPIKTRLLNRHSTRRLGGLGSSMSRPPWVRLEPDRVPASVALPTRRLPVVARVGLAVLPMRAGCRHPFGRPSSYRKSFRSQGRQPRWRKRSGTVHRCYGQAVWRQRDGRAEGLHGRSVQEIWNSLPVALAAYNWGPGNGLDMWLKGGADPQKLPKETQAYINNVLGLTGNMQGTSGAVAPPEAAGGQPTTVAGALRQMHAQSGTPADPGTGPGANAADSNATGPSEADKTAMDIYTKQRTGIENAALATPVARQRVMAIMDAMKKYQSGHWSTDLASIKAGLKAVGIQLPESLADPAQVQISLKNNFQAALAQISGFASQPAAISLTQAQENFAHPDLQPEANLAIGAQAIGTFDWQWIWPRR